MFGDPCMEQLARRHNARLIMLIPDLTEVGLSGNEARRDRGADDGFTSLPPGPRLFTPDMVPGHAPDEFPAKSKALLEGGYNTENKAGRMRSHDNNGHAVNGVEKLRHEKRAGSWFTSFSRPAQKTEVVGR